MKRLAIVVLLAGAFGISAQETVSRPRTVADFFQDFTAEWIRSNPNQAAATRYFSGAEQEQFEQQLSPETAEFRHARAVLAQKGLERARDVRSGADERDRTRLGRPDEMAAGRRRRGRKI